VSILKVKYVSLVNCIYDLLSENLPDYTHSENNGCMVILKVLTTLQYINKFINYVHTCTRSIVIVLQVLILCVLLSATCNTNYR